MTVAVFARTAPSRVRSASRRARCSRGRKAPRAETAPDRTDIGAASGGKELRNALIPSWTWM